jgi:photosystem I reaction center subunit XII
MTSISDGQVVTALLVSIITGILALRLGRDLYR